MFVRSTLSLGRLAGRVGTGLWSDYGVSAQICSWARKVLPNSLAEAALVRNGLGIEQSKIKVIPNGVDERFASGDPSLFKAKYGIEKFILNVGHIGHARKNVLSLIRALAHIDRPAVIIGRIIDSKYGEACVREAANYRHILLIDGLDNASDMLASAYAACEVFVLPSMFETPGIAALEAGLAGAKIVITPYGGTREYFGGMATYVEPRSVASIREGIMKALTLPVNPALCDRLRKEFLWPRIAESTAQIYREVLDSV